MTFGFMLIVSGWLATLAQAAPPDNPNPDEAFAALKSFGDAGKELQVLGGGKEAELFRHQGRGCLNHMWFGGDWPGYEKTRIRIYVDDETTPSIDMELGLGHGNGFNDPSAPWGTARLGKTGHPSGLYNTYRIPFGRSIRVTAQLGEGLNVDPPFWWIIRGVENLPITIGGIRLPEAARLHLYKKVDYLAQPLEEFSLCDVQGKGLLYQVAMQAEGQKPDNLSFLEACMRAYPDGETKPLRLSSGLEDYFLGTYYFNRGRYANPVAGLTHIDPTHSSFSGYRLHEDDPVVFHQGLRLTCRCGEVHSETGKTIGDPPPTRYTTYTWLYQW